MSTLKALCQYGQSLWLDTIDRHLVQDGGLAQLVKEGISGLTSNPTIFEKAITASPPNDPVLRAAIVRDRYGTTEALYEALAIEDIRMAADILRPVYDETGGADGLVSLEVSPHLAHDTAGTISEAKRLWRMVDRPNLMLKVPATPEGIPAIEDLTADGINVNVTLIFSLAHYEAVAHAYLRGVKRHPDPRRIASVASFFVSRIDTAADRELEAIGTPESLALCGRIAVANAKVAYRRFRELFSGERWEALSRRGARVQRLLWGSTGTKNPVYSDVLYVEELIGPDTVNTMPLATLNAFRDHGQPRASLTEGLDEAEADLDRLVRLEIDLAQITSALQREGVASFARSFDQLLEVLEQRRTALLPFLCSACG